MLFRLEVFALSFRLRVLGGIEHIGLGAHSSVSLSPAPWSQVSFSSIFHSFSEVFAPVIGLILQGFFHAKISICPHHESLSLTARCRHVFIWLKLLSLLLDDFRCGLHHSVTSWTVGIASQRSPFFPAWRSSLSSCQWSVWRIYGWSLIHTCCFAFLKIGTNGKSLGKRRLIFLLSASFNRLSLLEWIRDMAVEHSGGPHLVVHLLWSALHLLTKSATLNLWLIVLVLEVESHSI